MLLYLLAAAMGGLTFSSSEAELQFAQRGVQRCYSSQIYSRAAFLIKVLALVAPAAAAGRLPLCPALLLAVAAPAGLILALISREISPRCAAFYPGRLKSAGSWGRSCSAYVCAAPHPYHRMQHPIAKVHLSLQATVPFGGGC